MAAIGGTDGTVHARRTTPLGTAASVPAPVDEAGYQKLVASRKGQVLLVDFLATWCIPCREEMPRLVKLAAQHTRGFKLVTISCDEPEQEAGAAAFLAKNNVAPPHYIKHAKNDDRFINSVDPKWSGALPGLFLYDRQGRLVKSYIGEADMNALEAAVRKLL